MKKHAIHTTKGGDQFLQTHITEATPWYNEAYRPPAKPHPSERASDIVTMFAALAGVGGLLLIGYIILK